MHLILVSSDAKVSIPMTIWIALRDLTSRNYLLRMHYLASCLVIHVQTQSIHTQLEFGLPLGVGQWQISMTSTCSWMCFVQPD